MSCCYCEASIREIVILSVFFSTFFVAGSGFSGSTVFSSAWEVLNLIREIVLFYVIYEI